VAATTIESSSSPGTSGLVLTLGNSLVGSPSATALQVAAVGPGTQAGVTALAANTPGVLQGITYGQSLGRVSPYGEIAPVSADEEPVTEESTAPLDGALVATQERQAPNPDQRALAAATNWLGGLGSAIIGFFGSAPEAPAEPLADPRASADPIVLAHGDAPRAEADQVEQHADLATPLGLGVMSVLAMRVRQPVRRWMGRRNGESGRYSAAKTAVKGPHARI